MTTGGRVVAVVPDGSVVTDGPAAPAVVVVDSTVDDVDVDEDGVVVEASVEVGRKLVVGDWVATCWRDELSGPVATSTRRAARAMDASAYSPALKR